MTDPTHNAVVWYTNSFLSVFLDGVHIIADPIGTQTFKTWLNMRSGWQREAVALPDMVTISHHHFDHYDPAYLNALYSKKRFTLIVPEDMSAGRKLNRTIQPHRVRADEGMTIQRIRVRPFRCEHILAKPVRVGRCPCFGYLYEGSRTICFMGDTVYTPEYKAMLCGCGIDVLMLPAGGRTILSIFKTHLFVDDAFQIIAEVKPRMVIPIHWGCRRTVRFLLPEKGDVRRLKAKVEKDTDSRFLIPESGVPIEV